MILLWPEPASPSPGAPYTAWYTALLSWGVPVLWCTRWQQSERAHKKRPGAGLAQPSPAQQNTEKPSCYSHGRAGGKGKKLNTPKGKALPGRPD